MVRSREYFEGLYEQYSVLVYNVALNYVQNVEDAEEITQDVFIQVHDSLGKFNGKSSFKTWIYRIAINKSLDFIKQKGAKKRFFSFGLRGSDDEVGRLSDFEHPGILLERKEEARELFAVIELLPESQRTAFLLSKVDGMSNTEVGEIMQLSVSAVESLVFRAKNSLKERLVKNFPHYHKKK